MNMMNMTCFKRIVLLLALMFNASPVMISQTFTEEAEEAYNKGFQEESFGNYKQAIKYYLIAEKGGIALATIKLAYFYAEGKGYVKNMTYAHAAIDRALKEFKEKDLSYNLGGVYYTYKNCLDCKGEFYVMEGKYDKALPIWEQLKDDPSEQIQDSPFIIKMKEYLQVSENSHSTRIHNEPVISSYIFPYYKESNDPKLYLTKIEITSSYTIFYLTSYNSRQATSCNIRKNSYIEFNNQKFYLKTVEGIELAPGLSEYPNYASGNDVSLSFKLYFPSIPSKSGQISFFEGGSDGWCIKDILLNKYDNIQVTPNIIDCQNYRIELVSVQCQENQTILTKKVSSQESGYKLRSSQEDFVEDTDTGRKYYLIKSSIGFEGNPTISYDNKPIEFYEVYPALPASVKRINVSSGSQYYIKNLSIR